MKIEIKDISQVEKEMKITIEAEQATKDYYKILNKMKKYVAIPGFRKGKSPTALIERNYADYIKEEFYNQIIVVSEIPSGQLSDIKDEVLNVDLQ